MLVSLLLAVAPVVSVPVDADRQLPCAVHQHFVDLARRQLTPTEPLVARFSRGPTRWTLTLEGADGRAQLIRELELPCTELAPVAVAIVQRYLLSLTVPAAAWTIPPLKPTPPLRPKSAPPKEPRAPGVTEPTVIDAGVLTSPDVDASSPPLEPDSAPPAVVEAPVAPPPPPPEVRRPVIAAAPPLAPTGFILQLVPVTGLGAWWETGRQLGPSLTVGADLFFGKSVRAALLVTTRWPEAQAVTLPDGRTASLSAWSSMLLAGGGWCSTGALRFCADGLGGARVVVAQSSGQLYRRRDLVFALPTAGARLEAHRQLGKILALTVSLTALVPFGRSSVGVEGTSASYATPPVDLLLIAGVRFTP